MQQNETNRRPRTSKRKPARTPKNTKRVTGGGGSEGAAVFKVDAAAKVAGTSARAIRDGVRKNVIPHIMFGRNIVIPKAAFLNWLNSCGDPGKQA